MKQNPKPKSPLVFVVSLLCESLSKKEETTTTASLLER